MQDVQRVGVTRIDAKVRPPEPGLVVKGWNSGAVWAGYFSGSPKMASCDWWMPIPRRHGGPEMSDTECGWPISTGRLVRLRVSVWDDGQDHHPPGFLGHAGDVLQVYERRDGWMTVTHDLESTSSNTFLVKDGEVELYWEQPDLFPQTLPTTKKEMYP